MFNLANQQVLVIGLGASGQAACRLLRVRGAQVVAVDQAENVALQSVAVELRGLGVEVRLGVKTTPPLAFDLAVLSPGVPVASALVQDVLGRHIPLMGELELGYQQSLCLNIAISGT